MELKAGRGCAEKCGNERMHALSWVSDLRGKIPYADLEVPGYTVKEV